MQKEQDCLQKNLKSAKIRIQDLHCQNFAKINLELQYAKAKLNQYNPKSRKLKLKIIREREQCKHAQEKRQEAINQ